jgi:hypothetical protein
VADRKGTNLPGGRCRRALLHDATAASRLPGGPYSSGAPDADLLVRSPVGAIASEVQIKARSGRSGNGWRMSEEHERIVRDRLFYCFVDFGHETDWPVYVIPAKDVGEYLRQSHAA